MSFARFALLVPAILALSLATVQAQETKQPTLSVSAMGEASAAPDMAIVTLTVLREAKTAREALDAANQAMRDVLKSMQEGGIEQRDLQTSNFNIQPRYKRYDRTRPAPDEQPEIIGYSVSNSLSVRVRDLEKLGGIIDRSVSLGVNSGGNIRLTNAEPDPIMEKARIAAVKAALAKAKTLADAAGVELGKMTQLTEFNRNRVRQRSMARMETAAQMDVPISAGENTYSVTVNVSWEIAQ